MALHWTSKGQSNLARLYEFLPPIKPEAAVRVVRQVVAGGEADPVSSSVGSALSEFAPREVFAEYRSQTMRFGMR